MERTIAFVTDVKDLSDLLNGANVDDANLVPIGGRMQLELHLTRAMAERQQVVRAGLLRRVKTPWTKCELTLKGITTVAVKRVEDAATQHMPLLACDAVKGGYQVTVQAPDGVQFVLGLERLDGAFADVGSPIDSP
ncbi:MAG: hypothetical protein HYZ88_02365 [Candidatus Omnitrophica bacterium]|nr:hypothetical protein [Candidatus Omnitrophota bacterium]